MKKWEYKILDGTPNLLTADELNDYDAEGWELVTAYMDRLIFRRPFIEGLDQLDNEKFLDLFDKQKSGEKLSYEEKAYLERWAPVLLVQLVQEQMKRNDKN